MISPRRKTFFVQTLISRFFYPKSYPKRLHFPQSCREEYVIGFLLSHLSICAVPPTWFGQTFPKKSSYQFQLFDVPSSCSPSAWQRSLLRNFFVLFPAFIAVHYRYKDHGLSPPITPLFSFPPPVCADVLFGGNVDHLRCIYNRTRLVSASQGNPFRKPEDVSFLRDHPFVP